MKINWRNIWSDTKEMAEDHWKELLGLLTFAVLGFLFWYYMFTGAALLSAKCSSDTQFLVVAMMAHAWVTQPKKEK